MKRDKPDASSDQVLTPKLLAFAAASVVLGLIGLRLHVVQSESNAMALKAARDSFTEMADLSFKPKDDGSSASRLYKELDMAVLKGDRIVSWDLESPQSVPIIIQTSIPFSLTTSGGRRVTGRIRYVGSFIGFVDIDKQSER